MLKFVEGTDVAENFSELLKEATKVNIAVAFWGSDGPQRIRIPDQPRPRIICNLQSGACDPNAIRWLTRIADVRSHRRLHAKVYATSKGIIIGSSNASTNGLAITGQDPFGWEEANVLTDDPVMLERITDWFNRIWKDAADISELDLQEAQDAWEKRRAIARGLAPASYHQQIDQLPDGLVKERLKRIYDMAMTNNYSVGSTGQYPEFCLEEVSVFKILSRGKPLTLHWDRMMNSTLAKEAVQSLRDFVDELFRRPKTDLSRALHNNERGRYLSYDSPDIVAKLDEPGFSRFLRGLANFANEARNNQ